MATFPSNSIAFIPQQIKQDTPENAPGHGPFPRGLARTIEGQTWVCLFERVKRAWRASFASGELASTWSVLRHGSSAHEPDHGAGPRLDRAEAISAPMPREAPVTRARFP